MTVATALMALSTNIASYLYGPVVHALTEEGHDDDHAHSDDHAVFIGKMISIPIMFVLVLGASLMPWFLQRLNKAKMWIAFATCLSAGAMLGIGLLHVFPEAREVWEEYLGAHSHEDHAHGDDDEHVHNIQGMVIKAGARVGKRVVYKLMSAATLANTTAQSALSPASITVLAEEAAHSHPFPWTELCAGLCVLFLVSAEVLVTSFLNKRGNIQHCHGHSHGMADEEHEHLHAHTHGHGHAHGHTHAHAHEKPNYVHAGVGISGNLQAEATCVETDACGSACADGYGSVCDTAVCDTNATACVGDLEAGVPVPDSLAVNTTSSGHTASAAASATVSGNMLLPLDTLAGAPVAVADDKVTDADDLDEKIDPVVAAANAARKRDVDAFISALAICIHCIFNGLALGASHSHGGVFWTFFGASVGHKVVDGFATGVPVYRAQLSRLVTGIILFIVAFSCPLGVIIGYAVSNSNEAGLAQAVIMSLSGGSFLFVAMFELIPAGLANTKSWLWVKVFCMFVGFAVVAIVAKWA